ncbi:MAG: hypothetical protein WCV90_02575 [Candidatus Woesearchaeota archaeon]|jgi:hypothetical protein
MTEAYYGGQIRQSCRGRNILVIEGVEDRLKHFGARILTLDYQRFLDLTNGEPSAYSYERIYIGVNNAKAREIAANIAVLEDHARLRDLDDDLLSSTTLPHMQFKPFYGGQIKEENRGSLTLVINKLPEEKKFGSFLYDAFDEEIIHLTGVATVNWPIQRVYVGINHFAAESVMGRLGDLTTMDELASREWDRMLLDPRFLK